MTNADSRFLPPSRPRSGAGTSRGRTSARGGTAAAALLAATTLLLLQGMTTIEAQEWLDPVGDVKSPNADIACSAAVVESDTVHLIVRFVETPIRGSHQRVTWWIDLDRNPHTTGWGVLDNVPGADLIIGFDRHIWYAAGLFMKGDVVPDRTLDLSVGRHSNFTGSDELLHILLPLDYFEDDGDFGYLLHSGYSGSLSNHEFAPDLPSFETATGHYTSRTGSIEACGLVLPGMPDPAGRVEALIPYLDLLDVTGHLASSETQPLRQDLIRAVMNLERGREAQAIGDLESAIGRMPMDDNEGDPVHIWYGMGDYMEDQIRAAIESIRTALPSGETPQRTPERRPGRRIGRPGR